ncbi:unnamed protein product, partial [Phaeothamnion confervicola]
KLQRKQPQQQQWRRCRSRRRQQSSCPGCQHQSQRRNGQKGAVRGRGIIGGGGGGVGREDRDSGSGKCPERDHKGSPASCGRGSISPRSSREAGRNGGCSSAAATGKARSHKAAAEAARCHEDRRRRPEWQQARCSAGGRAPRRLEKEAEEGRLRKEMI